MAAYLLGVDAGTTASKALLFDLEGDIVASSSREYPVIYPKPTWAEQDPNVWWKTVAANIRDVVKGSGVKPDEIAGVAVDSQREAPVPLDKRGEALSNAIIWLDRRTLPQAEKIKEAIPNVEVIEETGVPADYFYSAAKILWLKEHRPHTFKKTSLFLFPKDYLVFKLTGQRVTDYSMASRTMLFNIHELRWSERLCADLDIPPDLLPDVKPSTENVGELTPEAAHLVGLRQETPVAAGGGDRPCEALGAGVIAPGQVNIGTGTATCLEVPLPSPRVDLQGRFDCCCHVIPGHWEYEVVILTTGASLKWFRDTFGYEEVQKGRRDGVDPYAYFDALAKEVPPGCEDLFYYPYPMGAKAPRFNNLAKGVFYGFTLGHTKSHFIRAILEGIAFQYTETLLLLQDFEVRVREASIVGGESRSALWNQIKTDVMNKPLRTLKVSDAAALGSAILAGVASQVFTSVQKAARQMVHAKNLYRPDIGRSAQYRAILQKYDGVYSSLEKGYILLS